MGSGRRKKRANFWVVRRRAVRQRRAVRKRALEEGVRRRGSGGGWENAQNTTHRTKKTHTLMFFVPSSVFLICLNVVFCPPRVCLICPVPFFLSRCFVTRYRSLCSLPSACVTTCLSPSSSTHCSVKVLHTRDAQKAKNERATLADAKRSKRT